MLCSMVLCTQMWAVLASDYWFMFSYFSNLGVLCFFNSAASLCVLGLVLCRVDKHCDFFVNIKRYCFIQIRLFYLNHTIQNLNEISVHQCFCIHYFSIYCCTWKVTKPVMCCGVIKWNFWLSNHAVRRRLSWGNRQYNRQFPEVFGSVTWEEMQVFLLSEHPRQLCTFEWTKSSEKIFERLQTKQ